MRSATRLISKIGPAVPSRSETFETVPTTMSGGARLNEPPEVTIGAPGRIVPKRCALSINRTIGTRDGPRPSRIPVSRTGNSPLLSSIDEVVGWCVFNSDEPTQDIGIGNYRVTHEAAQFGGLARVVANRIRLDANAEATASRIGFAVTDIFEPGVVVASVITDERRVGKRSGLCHTECID